jgi:hypothetical protein
MRGDKRSKWEEYSMQRGNRLGEDENLRTPSFQINSAKRK